MTPSLLYPFRSNTGIMASSRPTFASLFLLLLLLLLLTSAQGSSLNTTAWHPECETPKAPRRVSSSASSFVPSADFVSTLQSTLEEIKKVMSLVSTFSGVLGGDLRLSSAVDDCLDLLDLSSDELTWTLSASQRTTASASASGAGNRRSDLRSWMSAALGNQDTCKEGLDGTGGLVETLVAGGLDMVTSLVSDGLREIAAGGGTGGKGGSRRLMGFPEWVSAADRRLLQAQPTTVADAVVAQDGSGNYTTVEAAVAAAPTEGARRYVIHVKKGVYKENVEVKKKKWNLMLVGDGMGQTVISGSRSYVDGWTTYRSATFAVAGKGFIARDLTIENTAGPQKHQAVALRSDSDLSVFYRCEFSGYQDTLYAHSLRQFFRECRVTGTVDFVFGNAAAVFQNCQLFLRRPLPEQKNSVTAQGRKDPNQNTGFSFQFCNVSADADLVGFTNSTPTYLGRPWKEYSRTVFMQSYLGSLIRPEGWLEWNAEFALDTLYYAEYMNYGPGSGLGNRVKWPGYHALSDPAMVANFTVAQFIDGNMWLPSTGVKYTAGLTV
ncbi:pectinesterase/pectinesterase inhibitor PPE8B-like [Musa acuminata AAA Group]|uniref:pectinesterase/pectinesterase inhibitor PPE8B-like n=1 Tax=Musa acuminata AAA Group TaxID=214697 RepID=UPI0031D855E6